MVQYLYRQRPATVNGRAYPSFIPSRHSALKEIVYHTQSIPTGEFSMEQYTWCYVKFKDNPKRWKKIYAGPKKNIQIPNLEKGWHDIHEVLFAFEKEEVRKTPTTRNLLHKTLVERLE